MASSHDALQRRQRITRSVTAALTLSLSLCLAAAPRAVAQDNKVTPQDSAAKAVSDSINAAAYAACTKLKAYTKQLAADSIKKLWDNKTLFKQIDNILQAKGPIIVLDTATAPDSVRTFARTAGASCKPGPTSQVLTQLVQKQMQAPRPILGIQMAPLTTRDTANGVTDGRGVKVQAVTPNYGAAAAGIVAGDVIIGVDDKPLADVLAFRDQAMTWKEGEVVTVEVAHKGGAREKVKITTKMSE